MASTDNSKQEFKTLDISKLSLQELAQVKSQLDEELNLFQNSLHSLKIAQNKFQDSKESLEKISPECNGKEIMVPLSGSIYVPGRIADAGKFTIDIGTGYYIEKDLEGAKDYFKRKVNFVTEEMEKIQAIGVEKSKIREVVVDMMEVKIQQLNPQKPLVKS